MGEQLDYSHLDTAPYAVKAIQKAALNSDDPNVRITGIRYLSQFASQTIPEDTYRLAITNVQRQVRDSIAAIAFGSQEEAVRLEAIQGLGVCLNALTLEPGDDNNSIQLIAIIGRTSSQDSVKNAAIVVLADYSYGGNKRGWRYGKGTHFESRNYANQAVGVVSKPTAPVIPSSVNP